jgi:hypothetical protein
MISDTHRSGARRAAAHSRKSAAARVPLQGRPKTDLRVAILSTPRGGNTWLRHLLALLYGSKEIAAFSPADVDWANLPAGCVLQIHWHRWPAFQARLDRFGFRPVALARHPLDVLISILQFSLHEPTARWLEGEAGNEYPIFGAMPRSAAFLEYATGKRATSLLAISREWWSAPGCLQVRYESLVKDTPREVERMMRYFGVETRRPLAEIVEATSLAGMRRITQNRHHFWQGKAGLWKSLLPAAEAERIAAAHPEVFAELGYACDPDPYLTESQADANWTKLAWSQLADDLHNLRALQRTIDNLEARLTGAQTELEQARSQLAASLVKQQELHALKAEMEVTRERLAQSEGVGPLGLRVARKLTGFSRRHPTVAKVLKAIVRTGPRSETKRAS